jgi:hypothetical protein
VWYDDVVPYVVQAIPFLLIAVIVGLTLKSVLRGRVRLQRPPRAPRPKKSTLRDVSRDRMDDELQELIRRRSS